MRFKLTLRPVKDRQRLLFNYSYPLQAWIYGLLGQADADYATFLHARGYEVPATKKSFKHFHTGIEMPQMFGVLSRCKRPNRTILELK